MNDWNKQFLKALPPNLRDIAWFMKNRRLGPDGILLKDLHKTTGVTPQIAARWLVDNGKELANRKQFGGWKKKKNKGHIVHIPDGYGEKQ